MSKATDHLETLDTMISEAVQRGLMHHTAEDAALDGRIVTVGGRELLNFGSCSYLGLELDPRLKAGAIAAVERYGTQFSSSRAYMSAPPYAELEGLFEQLFGAPVLLAPTTSLAHLSALPVLIDPDEDAVIFDQQVHSSVQTALKLVRGQKAHIELLRHNRMDVLAERVEVLSKTRRKVWYLADGIYSMYGDTAPMAELAALLNRHEQFHLYVDDAHGMSWHGQNGRGYVLECLPSHPRMVVATSLAKAFGVGGGVLVFPDGELRRRVKTCGGPMIFSGPIQPPSLGAAIASARLHLSGELPELQQAMQARIRECNRMLEAHGLPLVSFSECPIRFIGMGQPRVAFRMVERLLEAGFFTNVAMFPAVPMKRAGVRFTLTLHQSLDDIRRLVEALAHHLPAVLAAEETSLASIHKAFDLTPVLPEAVDALALASLQVTVKAAEPELSVEHHTTIHDLRPDEWDRLLGANGSFTWEGLRFLEETFRDQPDPANNWKFHYYVVRDRAKMPVLATFFTESLWKDDMLASARVSRQVEESRKEDPTFLTSRCMAMGSLLTEGNHLYLDRTKDWKRAMTSLLEAVEAEQERAGIKTLALRDLPADDPELEAFLRGLGYVKVAMPESMVLELDWQDDEAFLQTLSPKARYHQRREVLPWEPQYRLEVIRHGDPAPSRELLDHLYGLYRNVKTQNLALNTFDLPTNLFERMLQHPGWELLLLYLDDEAAGDRPVGVGAAFVGPEQYCPMVIGLDYRFVPSHRSYRQSLLQAMRRAQALGKRRLLLGMGAGLEKRRFGARPEAHCLYLQTSDLYPQAVLAQMEEAG
ncbi:MAG TPA: aminotransferase class I/II-fold pyridoxal phosphate-dependent enzyme [Stenomitos sp.]